MLPSVRNKQLPTCLTLVIIPGGKLIVPEIIVFHVFLTV